MLTTIQLRNSATGEQKTVQVVKWPTLKRALGKLGPDWTVYASCDDLEWIGVQPDWLFPASGWISFPGLNARWTMPNHKRWLAQRGLNKPVKSDS